ncbi:hypothetical protein BGZ93_009041 [Podila epicladia]|nr:hypothetical protein BGZ92_006777 [Podila epicladia]KAG0091009.1 hypothetical protein BGZ93_009041 [Podila epicladia]
MDPGWAGPRLPNELLLMVTEHFHDDPKTLWTLLFVGRFFFHAAVPLLYADPFKFVRSRNKPKLTEIILASVIHTQRRFSQSRSSDSSTKPFTVAGFLVRFGLLLVDECAPPHLLQDALTGISPTTIDYAQQLKVQLPKEEHNSKIDSILRPKSRLAKADNLTKVFDILGQEIEVQRWVANTTASKRYYSKNPAEFVWKRFGALLIQCYPEGISTLNLGVYDSYWYLPLADKLGSLQTVHVQRTKKMEDEHLQDTVSFLTKNRIAFPQKKPIYLRFNSEWSTPWGRAATPQEKREFKREQQWPRVALYAAVGNPVHMNASPCPRFYEDVSVAMGLDSLDSFVDMDRCRFKYGESSFQQAFLRRCHNLRALQLLVSDPQLFSWAVDAQSASVVPGQRISPPSKLQELNLRLHTGTTVLKGAFAAYGQSLRKLKIRADIQAVHRKVMDPVVFGDWSLPLVRKIEIEVTSKSIVHLDDFSECHRLETLKLIVNDLSGSSPCTKPVDKPVRLAPIWKLSILRTVQLHGTTALQFNFDSLNYCPNLEILKLVATSCNAQCTCMASIPCLPHHSLHPQALDNRNIETSMQEQRWRSAGWKLPKLRTLDLVGIPSSAFCLDWLIGCPALTCLKLTAHGAYDLNVLLCRNDDPTIGPIALPMDDQLSARQTRPRLVSKLTCITLEGPWIISEEAFLTLLTKYAPRVTELRMDKIDQDPLPKADIITWHGNWLLRTFKNAMKINHGSGPGQSGGMGARAAMSPARWGKLRYFSCPYNISWYDKEALGLSGIGVLEVDNYQKAEKLVVKMGDQHYIRKKDKI